MISNKKSWKPHGSTKRLNEYYLKWVSSSNKEFYLKLVLSQLQTQLCLFLFDILGGFFGVKSRRSIQTEGNKWASASCEIPRSLFNFIKIEIFAQNHLILFKKLKRPKKLSYQEEPSLVLWDFFLYLFNFKKLICVFLEFQRASHLWRRRHNCGANQTILIAL